MRAASQGDQAARSAFARGYASPIRAYLTHRWRGLAATRDLEDAIQDVFVECYKPGGVIETADPGRGDFRALLYGVVRNVARRYEERFTQEQRREPGEIVDLDALPEVSDGLSRVFDRAWAQALLREAVQCHEASAMAGDADARRRFAILRMRHDGALPVREIASALGEPDVEKVHNEYRRARRDFAVHLRTVVAAHTGVQGDRIDDECRRLGELLGS